MQYVFDHLDNSRLCPWTFVSIRDILLRLSVLVSRLPKDKRHGLGLEQQVLVLTKDLVLEKFQSPGLETKVSFTSLVSVSPTAVRDSV